MVTIQKKDFVEVEYTGTVKAENEVFDTTNEDVAKKHSLHSHRTYGPAIVCVGEELVLKGLDKQLEGKEVGKEYTVDIRPEDGFGEKNPQLIQLIPIRKFKQQNIQPMPGLQLNFDGMMGTVKTVSGGRTMVDFNHPLAGKELSYTFKIHRKIENDQEKVQGFLKATIGDESMTVSIADGVANVRTKQDLPKEIQEEFKKKLLAVVSGLKDIKFTKNR